MQRKITQKKNGRAATLRRRPHDRSLNEKKKKTGGDKALGKDGLGHGKKDSSLEDRGVVREVDHGQTVRKGGKTEVETKGAKSSHNLQKQTGLNPKQ